MEKKLIMKRLRKLLHKVNVHPATVIYFVISLFTGYLKDYLIIYLLVCFHELCHFIMAYSFHFEIGKIEFLPFGLYLELVDYGFKPKIIDCIVILSGLCSHFAVYLFNVYVLNDSFVYMMNRIIFVFNLIPIYPLDGYRLVLIIIQNFMDMKKSIYIMNKLSILLLCVFMVFYNSVGNYVLFGYLLYMNVLNYYNVDRYLMKYYLNITYQFNNKKRIHTKLRYIRDCDNYYLFNNKIYNAEDLKFELIQSIKYREN